MPINPENPIFHRDRGVVMLPPKPQLTPEGFLRTYMRIARVGELKYRNIDGTEQIEVVSPGVLFDKESMDSFKMKPITYPHPPVEVTSLNSMQYQRGLLGHYAVIDGDFLGFVGTVTDKTAIDALLSGDAREASCGYKTTTLMRSDGKLDQVHRLGNHVAIVPHGRAGSDVRFHVDSNEPCWYQLDASDELYRAESEILSGIWQDIQSVQIWDFADRSDRSTAPTATETDDREFLSIDLTDETNTNLDAGRRKMPRQINIKGEIFSIEDDALADAILELMECGEMPAPIAAMGYSSYNDAAIDLKAKLDAAEGSAVGLQSRVDALQSELDAAQGSRMDGDAIAVEVSTRADAWNMVLPLLRTDAADFQPDYKLDVAGIHKLAIAKKMPTLNLDGKSAEFVQGVWASIAPSLSQSEQRSDSSDDLLGLVQQVQRQDADMGMAPSPIAAKRKARSQKAAGCA